MKLLTTALLASLLLGACSKTTPAPPAPMVQSASDTAVPGSPGAPDTSVPSAATVLSPATASSVDPAAGRANKAMSKAQESSAMPMPGQNNDHSAPLTPAKRASGP